MFIYLFCYLLVSILLYGFERQKHQWLVIFLCIMILSLLAGFRDVSVSTDVRIYAQSVYYAVSGVSNIAELFNLPVYTINGIEIGYLVLAFIGSKIFGSLFGLLFLTSLIINTGVFVGLYRIKERLSYNIAMIVYCFMFYQNTYNMMRQWMAMAIIIYGIKYIYDRNLFKYIVVILVATLFHRTAFIGILLYAIAAYVEKPHNLWRQTVVLTLAVIGVIFFQYFVTSVISEIMPKYLHYADGDEVSLFWQELATRIPAIALCAVLYKPMKTHDEHHAFWFLMMLVEMIISQLHSIMDFAGRIGSYFNASRIIEMSIACKIGRRNQRILSKSLVVMYAVMYWFVM